MEVGDWFQGARRAWRIAGAVRTAVDEALRPIKEHRATPGRAPKTKRHLLRSWPNSPATPIPWCATMWGATHARLQTRSGAWLPRHLPVRSATVRSPVGRPGRLSPRTRRCRSTCSVVLARDEEAYVRAAVAGNDSTTPDERVQLASDTDDLVRMTVAAHPNKNLGVLIQLAQNADPGSETARSLIDNPNCPEEIRAALAVHAPRLSARA